jgi:hypothetical protein
MGNNAAFGEFEFYTVTLYDKGVLDKELLTTIMERYRGTDIDSGGKEDLSSKDGLDIEQIVLKVFGVSLRPRPVLPADSKTWTPADHLLNKRYWDWHFEQFSKIANGMFGWC